jgi:hypothetical protein
MEDSGSKSMGPRREHARAFKTGEKQALKQARCWWPEKGVFMGEMGLFLCKEQAPVFQGGLCTWGKMGFFLCKQPDGAKEAEKGLIQILPRKHRQE